MKRNKQIIKFPIEVKTRFGRALSFAIQISLGLISGTFILFVVLPILLALILGKKIDPPMDAWFKFCLLGLLVGLVAFMLLPVSEWVDEWNEKRKAKRDFERNKWNEEI